MVDRPVNIGYFNRVLWISLAVGDSRLFTVEKPGIYTTLAPLVGGSVNSKQILAHWGEIPRIATFIEHGSVTVCRTKPALGNSMYNLTRLLHQHK